MAVQGLKVGRAGGPSGIRAEDLKGWLRGAKRKKYPERIRWEIGVRLVQVMFGGGTVPEKIAWMAMVLLQRGKWE